MGKKRLLIKDKIKTVKIHIVRAMVRVLYIFPIKGNRIVLFSYYGKQYSCNPKAITEYILNKYGNRYEVIWAFIDPSKFKHIVDNNVKLVKYKSLKRLYLQATAKYTISNCGAFSWMPRRKKQIHVNTWHAGGAYKRLTTGTSYNRKLTARETSHMISGCKLFTKYNIYECFDYSGIVMPIGMPRNDVFFDTNKMKEIGRKTKEKLGLKESDFMILYAPTWRYDGKIPHPDYKVLKKAVKEKYCCNPVVVGRSHSVKKEIYTDVIDATDYQDMQELLCAADMLITDYSSSIWDYSFTYRPCCLYVEDLEKYEREQGFLTDIRDWGFPLAKNNNELYEKILFFDENDYKMRMERHHKMFGSYETGKATEKFCETMFENKKRNLVK